MTVIEFFLLIAIFILLLILTNYRIVTKVTSKIITSNKNKLARISAIFRALYHVFQKARYFSLVYILKNKFQRLYLSVAIAIILIKISLYYNFISQDSLPIWITKSTDFLFVSAAWELTCILTKFIEDKISENN